MRLWQIYRANWIFWTIVLWLLVLAVVLAVGTIGDMINDPPATVIREGG